MSFFCRNENFWTGFRVNETWESESDARFGVAPISDVSKIEHRQFLTFPCNKKSGLKLDDTYFFPKKLDDNEIKNCWTTAT